MPTLKPKKPAVKSVKKTVVKRPVSTRVKSENSLTVSVFNLKGESTGTVALPKEVFDVRVSPRLIAQSVYVFQTNKRQGNANTKTRGDVKGSGRKIYKQKGTGRARHGDRYAPIFVGGGVAHGPKTKVWELRMTDNMRKKAFAGVLTAKQKEKNVIIVDSLENIEPKSKKLIDVLSNLNISTKHAQCTEKVLVMTPMHRDNVYKGLRNVALTQVRDTKCVNVYDILNAKKVIIEKAALTLLGNRV